MSTFQFLLERVQKELDEVRQALGRGFQNLNKQQQQARTLDQFLADYDQELRAVGRTQDIGSLVNVDAFLHKIEDAIVQQGHQVQLAEHELTNIRARFIALNAKAKAFEVLIQRREHQQQAKLAKREQAESDQYALQLHRRRMEYL